MKAKEFYEAEEEITEFLNEITEEEKMKNEPIQVNGLTEKNRLKNENYLKTVKLINENPNIIIRVHSKYLEVTTDGATIAEINFKTEKMLRRINTLLWSKDTTRNLIIV